MLRFAGAAALVIGTVLLALIVLLLLALLPRVRVDVEKTQDGPLGLTVGYGWLRLRLLPRREKPKPAKKAPAKPKPAAKKPEKEKKASGFSIKGLDIGDAQPAGDPPAARRRPACDWRRCKNRDPAWPDCRNLRYGFALFRTELQYPGFPYLS